MPGYKQRRKVIIAGRYIRAVQYTMHCDQEARKSRAPKELVSSCAREAINLRHSWEKLKMLMAANFDFPDLVVTLTYADDSLPQTREAAEGNLKLFIRHLRAERRKAGQPLKYLYVTERGHTLGRYHHHIIVNATGADYQTIRSLWPHGDNIDFSKIADKGYDGWARYLSKEPREQGRRYVGERMWRQSLGLAKPITQSGWIDAGTPLTAPPGSYILDRQTRANGFGTFDYVEYLAPKNETLPGAIF